MNRTQRIRERHVIRVGPPSRRMPAPGELPRSLSTTRERTAPRAGPGVEDSVRCLGSGLHDNLSVGR